MKFKYLVTIATSVVILFSSCDKDFLDTKLNTAQTPESVASSGGALFSYAWAFYTPMRDGFAAIDNNLFATVSDEAQSNLPTYNAIYFNQGLISPNINPEVFIYKTYYEGIRAANNFLDYSIDSDRYILIGREPVADADIIQREKQDIIWFKAEAHIAQAYYYSELIKRYGGVPIVTETLQKSGNVKIPKSSYDEIVDYIVKKIDDNKANLQVNWKTSSFANNDGRFSLGSALAIKARVLLYAASPLNNPTNDPAKWRRAAAACNELLTTPGLNLALHSSYGDYFKGATTLTSNETIFAIRRAANNTLERENYPIATPGGRGTLSPTDNLVSAYQYKGTVNPTDPYANRDPRMTATIVVNGSTWNSRVIDQSAGGTDDMNKANASKTGYYLKKFVNDNLNLVQNATAQHNWVVFRYAELLLNYAEAMNEAYGPDGLATGFSKTARQAINEVRNRPGVQMSPVNLATTGDKDGFRIALKHERRIELAFEDHRYWDLLRWEDAETVLNQPIVGVKVTKVSSSPAVWSYEKRNVATRTFDPNANYRYPFTRAEIVNSQGTLLQNPGY